jgi:hypothetical protein
MPPKPPKSKQKPPSVKTVANAVARMTALLDGRYTGETSEVRTARGKTIFAMRGVDVASLEVVDGELIVEFLAATQLDEFADVMIHYAPVPKRRGWLRFRRPATSTPTPSLAAKLGQMIGAAAFERK